MESRVNILWLTPFNLRLILDRITWRRDRCRVHTHAGSWVVNLAAELARSDEVNLTILTGTPYVRGVQTAEWSGVKIVLVPIGIPGVGRGWPPQLPLDALIGYPYERWRVGRIVRQIPSDLVHVHGTEHFYGLVAARMSRPWVVSIQGILAEVKKCTTSRRLHWGARWERQVVRAARWFLCRTNLDIGFVQSNNPSARIFDIAEPVSRVYYGPPWDCVRTPRILFVSIGLPPWKGWDLLWNALEMVARQVPEVCLEVVGPVPPSDQAAALSRAANLGITVRFHGYCTPEQLARLHRECRVFVLPSRIENSPNALAEAMVSGMPCVAFAVGGVPSMIQDRVTGLLVPPEDVSAMAAAIVRVLKEDDLASSLGKAAATMARSRHDPARVAKQVIAAYREILADTQGPP